MNTEYNFNELRDERLVYVRPVDVSDLPDEVQRQADGLLQFYAVHDANGERLALVKDRQMAFALARFACASENDTRGRAMQRLWQAMVTHPAHVAGEGKACTELMRACSAPVAIKTGAEGFYIGILPQRGLGIALKIADGATRASECVIAALLVRLGVLEAAHPMAQRSVNPPILNRRGIVTGHIQPNPGFI